MTRPLYETEANLSAEREIAEAVAKVERCELEKLPPRHPLDYVLLRNGNVSALMEVKDRTCSMEQIDKWGGYMISLGKYAMAQALCKAGGFELILAVRAKGVIHCATFFAPETFPVKLGGRSDRGDPRDRELVTFIPVSRFKQLPALDKPSPVL